MATHPLQNMPNCTCDWGGDDHYPYLNKWNPTCPHHKNPDRDKVKVRCTISCRHCNGTGKYVMIYKKYYDEPLDANEEIIV